MATLIHEMYHAYETTTNHANSSEASDHVYMADHLNEMADMLRTFFPSMSAQTARDLTWGGLGETPAWRALSGAEQQRISNVNSDYRRGVQGRVCAI